MAAASARPVRVRDQAAVARRVRRLRRLATVLDAAITLPIVNVRVGWDPLIGLIPGVGDALGAVLASLIVIEAARLGVPPRLLVRMVLTIAIDTALGAVPIAGDWFDAVWRANLMNVDLIERHLGMTPRR